MSLFKKSAFISFDFDHDEFLRIALVGQANNDDSPFEIIDRSVKEHLTGDWKVKVKGRIQRANLVIVICGQHTHNASGVAAELQITKDAGKPYFLLKGYSDKNCTWPTTAGQQDKMYDWTWPNLKLLIGGSR
ncbi:MAG: hypothetical protein COV46_04500 [Deltaproteobacteria bacterium CG11_big_fil_rev_8_21_14_0_20_49_13]|nr:MAG: hypothetical protein COV46_04500 [Deltaproteobacteria bacterium CG11_big_fil_rev_8_21_14_0_20_49_13]